MADLRLEEEEIHHYYEKAKSLLGKTEITADEYERLADESAQQERFWAAAYYYHLAESQCLPSQKADNYKKLTREMMRKATSRGQRSQEDD